MLRRPPISTRTDTRYPYTTLFRSTPRPWESVTLAIRMKPESGWHGYWTNPGAAGLPVEADWDLPTGVTVSSLRHPAPHLLDVQGIASYVHDGPFTLDRKSVV